ncbi:hypothetical protein SAMN04489712_12828 [Thermomonospora echinospora]|uniref:Uncharacterized protein n=1 Tax=Thermomonospora echinospora TaxID=1992 RepID=A0A1H6E0H4_9ACTN|nr:hypothetical protein [Thermomonospora echinospora]SEG91072.1 hypothetical protein SAMN04489712_12828 [Thermomonospora echinospora]
MTPRVIVLRPRRLTRPPVRPRPVPARPRPVPIRPFPSRRVGSSVLVGPVVEWDGVRGLHIATCDRCADTMTAVSAGRAYRWVEDHECDPELAALLANLTGGTAA